MDRHTDRHADIYCVTDITYCYNDSEDMAIDIREGGREGAHWYCVTDEAVKCDYPEEMTKEKIGKREKDI